MCQTADDLSVMAAFTQTVAAMRAWEQQQQAEAAERQRSKK